MLYTDSPSEHPQIKLSPCFYLRNQEIGEFTKKAETIVNFRFRDFISLNQFKQELDEL
jgi:hypothetical protein